MRSIWAIYEGIVQCIFMWISAQYLHTLMNHQRKHFIIEVKSVWHSRKIDWHWFECHSVLSDDVWTFIFDVKKKEKNLKRRLRNSYKNNCMTVPWNSMWLTSTCTCKGALYHLVLIESRRKIILARYIQEIKVWKVKIHFHCG